MPDTTHLSRRRLLGAGAAGATLAATSLAATSAGAAPPDRHPVFDASENVYDVTTWKRRRLPDATRDIGAVINDIIRDVKSRQRDPEAKPGAVILIPPGDYTLLTPVVIDISYLTIAGYGHGFTSLSIRYNVDTTGWVERNPGGSHIRVKADHAFLVQRDDAPRLSGIVIRDLCLDGLDFEPDQNSYRNGKTGIEATSDNDSLHITGLGFVYLERALVIRGADALRVHDNMIAECGSCVELTGAGQATLVSDNLMGAGTGGRTLLAENHEGLLVTGNNLFPRGDSLIDLRGCNRSSITANRLQGFNAGMVRITDSKENLVSSNHIRRTTEGFPPFIGTGNGLDDLFGVIHLRGDNNLVTSNVIAFDVAPERLIPNGIEPTMILLAGGDHNVIATNHVIANLPAQHVVIDASTTRSKVLDTGPLERITSFAEDAAIRPTP